MKLLRASRNALFALCAFSVMAGPAWSANTPPSDQSLKQLLAITNARSLVDNVMVQTEAMVKKGVQAGLQGKELTPQQQAIIDRMVARSLAAMREDFNWDSLEPEYLAIYRESLTQEEVDGMLAFYQTPAGQSMIRKMPVIMQTTMTRMQGRMGPLMKKLQQIQAEAVAEISQQKKAPAAKPAQVPGNKGL